MNSNEWNELKKNLRKHPKFVEAVKDAQRIKDMYPHESRGVTAENMVTARIVMCEMLQGEGFLKDTDPAEDIDLSDIEALAEQLRVEQVQK